MDIFTNVVDLSILSVLTGKDLKYSIFVFYVFLNKLFCKC